MFDEMRNFCLLRKFPPEGSKHARCNERTQRTGARQYACEKGLPAGTSSVATCAGATRASVPRDLYMRASTNYRTSYPLLCGRPDRFALQMQPDWVVDFALTLPGVDTPRIDPIQRPASPEFALYAARGHDIRSRFHGDAEVIKTTGSGQGFPRKYMCLPQLDQFISRAGWRTGSTSPRRARRREVMGVVQYAQPEPNDKKMNGSKLGTFRYCR